MQSQSTKAIKVYFEVTNFCNFRCDFCPTNASRRKSQHMDFALFAKGIDDIARSGVAETVGFHVLGEPLLYPRLFDALDYAKARGLRTEINTNGSLLTEERVKRLVETGLDTLSISVQIIDEKAHACRGTSLPFDRYYRGVLEAVRLVKDSGCDTDVVLCAMDTSTKRYFDIDQPMRMNGSRGAFRQKLSRLILDTYSAVDRAALPLDVTAALARLSLSQPRFIRIDEHIVVYAQPFADWGNAFTHRKVYPAKLGFCGYALSNVGVLSNGEVTICCADYDGKTSLGNLNADSLDALLSSPKAKAIRAGFQRMKIVHPYCQRCVGSPNRVKALFKGLASIYLFKLIDFQPAKVKEVTLMRA
jgi:sulfatase maturation enzyme AslB (radical SAM superfamily)